MSSLSSSRRRFLQGGAAALAATSLKPALAEDTKSGQNPTLINVPFQAMNPRIGMIGVGGRGTSLLNNLLAADAQINAVCDVVADKARNAQELVTRAGQKAPELYTEGDHAFEKLVSREDLDFVVVATPWHWHTPMAVAAMKQNKYVATEVPAATTIE
ncbi:MAG: Gfo/Idh/MocA family protein, partial [Bryobacteraceae bacterium]